MEDVEDREVVAYEDCGEMHTPDGKLTGAILCTRLCPLVKKVRTRVSSSVFLCRQLAQTVDGCASLQHPPVPIGEEHQRLDSTQ